MSAKRAPSPPPQIEGFDYIQLLGSGGFADVFLYQQHYPKRRVAVKVMLKDAVAAGGVEAFTAEANLMAQLSTHPAIVSIYEADVSPDGRPYLVMEYCSKPNLQTRYRKQRLSVAEALRIGIQVAGAVETAHRAGILHRDIKPANILVTEYGRPALTDFGIAGTVQGQDAGTGLSIPWSPPESFNAGEPSAPTTDIWALGATVYTLLAGRSPFEIPGQKNTTADIMARIQSDPLPRIDRADVTDSLYRVLATAMAKRREDRYRTALEFARALQKVEIELAMSVTTIDVLDDSVEVDAHEGEDDNRTRVRSVVSIDPTGPAPSAHSRPAPTIPPLAEPPFSTADATVMRDATGAPVTAPGAQPAPGTPAPYGWGQQPAPGVTEPYDHTVLRGLPDAGQTVGVTHARPVGRPASEQPVAPAAAKRRWSLFAGIGAVVVIGGGIALATVLSGSDPSEPIETPTSVRPVDVDDVITERTVPVLTGVTGRIEGDQAVFTWTNPAPEAGDVYLWGVQVGGEAVALEATSETTVTVAPSPDGQTCIEVLLRRADGRASAEPAVGCAS